MPEAAQKFTAGPLTFVVRHELWDGNIHDHPDQGVSIDVKADIVGKETALLRFNCFDIEKSYVYGPENADLEVAGPEMLGARLPWPKRPNWPCASARNTTTYLA